MVIGYIPVCNYPYVVWADAFTGAFTGFLIYVEFSIYVC